MDGAGLEIIRLIARHPAGCPRPYGRSGLKIITVIARHLAGCPRPRPTKQNTEHRTVPGKPRNKQEPKGPRPTGHHENMEARRTKPPSLNLLYRLGPSGGGKPSRSLKTFNMHSIFDPSVTLAKFSCTIIPELMCQENVIAFHQPGTATVRASAYTACHTMGQTSKHSVQAAPWDLHRIQTHCPGPGAAAKTPLLAGTYEPCHR